MLMLHRMQQVKLVTLVYQAPGGAQPRQLQVYLSENNTLHLPSVRNAFGLHSLQLDGVLVPEDVPYSPAQYQPGARIEVSGSIQLAAGSGTVAVSNWGSGQLGAGRAHVVVSRVRSGSDALPGHCRCIPAMPATELLTPKSHAVLLAGAASSSGLAGIGAGFAQGEMCIVCADNGRWRDMRVLSTALDRQPRAEALTLWAVQWVRRQRRCGCQQGAGCKALPRQRHGVRKQGLGARRCTPRRRSVYYFRLDPGSCNMLPIYNIGKVVPAHPAADVMSKLKELQDQISGLKMSPRLSADAIKSIHNSMFLIFQVSQHCNQLLRTRTATETGTGNTRAS